MSYTEIIAHITEDGKSQTLLEHAKAVAELASGFAAEFNNADWAAAAAMWHDLGKSFVAKLYTRKGIENGEPC